jgi:hypothetical protein
LTLACSDDASESEPAEFGQLCGEAAPVQLLPLDPERPLAQVREVGVYEGRRVLEIDYRGGALGLGSMLPSNASQLWSVGPCGEDPLLLSERDNHFAIQLATQPEWLLECDWDSGQIWRHDPSGARAPNVVFESHQCFVVPLEDGVLSLRPSAANPELGALLFQAWPADPWTTSAEPLVVLEPVRTTAMSSYGRPDDEVLGVTADEYLVVRGDDELVAVSRLDHAVTPIASSVHSFDHAASGRYVVWQAVEDTSEGSGWREGLVSLTDRESGVTTPLTTTSIAYGLPMPFAFESAGVIYLRAEANTTDRFVHLESLDAVDVPEQVTVTRILDGTRVLIGSDEHAVGPYRWFDVLSGATTMAFEGSGGAAQPFADAITVLEDVQCCIDDDQRVEGPLWRVPFGGGEGELIAERATVGLALAGDARVVTPVDVDQDWVGSLIVVEPSTLAEREIDDAVFVFEPAIVDEIDGDPLVLYTVADPQRQGVWLARLATP